MIKRLIGVIAALGILTLLVFVVLHRAKYCSLLEPCAASDKTEQVAE